MDSSSAIFDLLNEYFIKTKTDKGTFKFGAQTLEPMDSRGISEAGLKEGDEIIVS